jgi:tetratricopeptide (TPR) repeat protein
MPTADIERRLENLKVTFQRLFSAYRRGDFERAIHLKTKNSLRPHQILNIFPGGTSPTPFSDAAVRLFEEARELDALYKEDWDIPVKLREEVAEYILRAQTVSYEIMDYFLIAEKGVSQHFLRMAKEVSKDVEGYYHRHYGFVITPGMKETIVKQVVLAALSGVNVLYRSYAAPSYSSALEHVGSLIEFLEKRFPKFRGKERTAFGLLGLAYFLKGRLLLGRSQYHAADDCFRRSAESYIRKLSYKEASPAQGAKAGGREAPSSAQILPRRDEDAEVVDVPVSKLLTLRRAALVLAFGRGYSALINSRIKEAVSFLTLARGVLHFNSPSVYAAYTELLYWTAKRAESSHDLGVLEEAKKGIEACRRVFELQVAGSHYPHRASIEHSLVLHYLAQQRPAKRAEYYREAVGELEAAIEFAKGDNPSGKPNVQLYAEACYNLSHIHRYRSADVAPSDAEESVSALREAFRRAKEAEEAAKHFARHRCEALLALCGVYTEIDQRGVSLHDVDPQARPGDAPLVCARRVARKAMEINNGANHRISGICYLRLVDTYLKNPNTYSRALDFWEDWLKIKDSIEHSFLKDRAVRVEAELNKVRARNLIIDLEGGGSIVEMRDYLNVSFAKRKIVEWVQDSHHLYKMMSRERPESIVRRREPGTTGRDIHLKRDLENYLMEELQVRKKSEVSKLIEDHGLLKLATDLMVSYMR